jgi:hypothetical protein
MQRTARLTLTVIGKIWARNQGHSDEVGRPRHRVILIRCTVLHVYTPTITMTVVGWPTPLAARPHRLPAAAPGLPATATESTAKNAKSAKDGELPGNDGGDRHPR